MPIAFRPALLLGGLTFSIALASAALPAAAETSVLKLLAPCRVVSTRLPIETGPVNDYAATCFIRNLSDQMVVRFSYRATVDVPGTTSPWRRLGYDEPAGAPGVSYPIPGGLAPGDQVPIHIPIGPLPEQAFADGVRVQLELSGPLNVQDLAIQGPPSDRRTKAQDAAFIAKLRNCWVVDPGSPSADVTVTVGVKLLPDGHIKAGSIKLIGSSGGEGTAANVAFDGVRSALQHCGGSGFSFPPDQYAAWKDLTLIFDPRGVRFSQ